jgi:bcr-type benzoyl-CoA reductase subunit C
MVTEAGQGLAKVREIYQDRPRRVKELREQGKKVMGYLCLYPVVELMTALDLVPYRILGDMKETVTQADSYLPPVVCPFLRSLLDLALKGNYDFLDGVTFSHTCDVGAQFAGNWKTNIATPFSHFLDMPHTTHEEAQKHQKDLMKDYQKAVESYFGKELSPARLKEAIEVHNQQRALVRELYDLKKLDPPLISGAETVQAMVAIMSLPVEEGNTLLREVISEVKERQDGLPNKKPVRLLVWGSIIDDSSLLEMIESLDANVVMDDTCVGSRAFFSDVEITDDPLDGLAYHYLVDIKCPRTFRETTIGATSRDYMTDLRDRFNYLGDFARDWKVNGVILQALRYCDAHGYEVPGIKDYLDSLGLPSIYLEHNYTEAAFAPLRTRVQGFLEIIG